MPTSSVTLFSILAIYCMVSVLAGRQIILPNRRIGPGYDILNDVSYFPHLLQLKRSDETFLCSGSLIDPLYVLTAAECFDRVNYTQVAVIAGASRASDNGTVRHIVKIQKHPHRYINVAVLKLNEPLNDFQVIPLGDTIADNISIDDQLKAVGWRHLAHRKSVTKELTLHKAHKAEQPKCEIEFYAAGTKKLFCLQGEEYIDEPCVSDVGGPVTYAGNLIGVVSGGHKCGDPNHLTAVTNLHDILPFIREAMH